MTTEATAPAPAAGDTKEYTRANFQNLKNEATQNGGGDLNLDVLLDVALGRLSAKLRAHNKSAGQRGMTASASLPALKGARDGYRTASGTASREKGARPSP